jgi:hypothetical protein
MRTVPAVLAAALLATACGADEPPRQAAPVRVAATCPPAGEQVGGGGVPADFRATAVIRCTSQVRQLPGRRGDWLVRVEERAAAGLERLLAELRRPSDPRDPGRSCTLEQLIVPYFMLIDAAGQAMVPAVPTDDCGKPRPEIVEALNALRYRTVSVTPVKPAGGGMAPRS